MAGCSLHLPSRVTHCQMMRPGLRWLANGTIPTIGLLYTVDLMDLIGFEKIEKRVKSLIERLRGGLDEVTRELHNVFLVLTIKFRDDVGTGGARRQRKSQEVKPELNEVLYDALYEHHHIGVSTKKGNRMRFSPHIYNMEEHIDRAVEAVRYELKKIRPRIFSFKILQQLL